VHLAGETKGQETYRMDPLRHEEKKLCRSLSAEVTDFSSNHKNKTSSALSSCSNLIALKIFCPFSQQILTYT
jgi:hypothetical protein